MTTQISIMGPTDDDPDAEPRVYMPCGEAPADEAVLAAGHQPNGYFWQSLIEYLKERDDLRLELEFDCESGTFVAKGEMSSVERVRTLLQVYTQDPQAVTEVIAEAARSGFGFDD
jgi:hypothetical protein